MNGGRRTWFPALLATAARCRASATASTSTVTTGTDLTRVTFGADFALTAPSSQSVKQGATTNVAIGIARTYFTLPVSLSLTGLPAGASATFAPTTSTGASSTLAVTTSRSVTVTPVGTYPLTISGTSNGITRTASAKLVVTDGIAPTVTSPRSRLYGLTKLGSGTTQVGTSWSAADPSGIASYALQRQLNDARGARSTWAPPPRARSSNRLP